MSELPPPPESQSEPFELAPPPPPIERVTTTAAEPAALAPPPPPQVSPDGRFYYDGHRWVPIPQSAPQTAPQPPSAVAVAHTTVVVNPGRRGQMPTWAAIAGLVFCVPLGLVMVGLTPWKVTTKVVVAGVAILAWIALIAAMGHPSTTT
jgi:hypothetical protein